MCDTIIRHDALQKRKVYLDAIALGLDEFKVLTAMKCFPELFEDMFVSLNEVLASDVLGMLRFPGTMSPKAADILRECVKHDG